MSFSIMYIALLILESSSRSCNLNPFETSNIHQTLDITWHKILHGTLETLPNPVIAKHQKEMAPRKPNVHAKKTWIIPISTHNVYGCNTNAKYLSAAKID